MENSEMLVAIVATILSFTCVIVFFGFVVLQSVAPKKLINLLKPKDWQKFLTQRSDFSVIGMLLIAAQFIGGIWAFSSIIYSTLLWTDLINIRDAILYGFIAYSLFLAAWMKAERKYRNER